MPLSFSMCGGKPPSSASAIVVDSARGSHDLRIDAASFATGAPAPTGQSVRSSAFTVGGHRWRIRYYPNGNGANCWDHVSLYLDLDEDDVAGEVKAVFGFTLVAESSAVSFLRRRKVVQSWQQSMCVFSNQQKSWGWSKFMKRYSLQKLYGHKADSFIIRCPLTVITDVRTEGEGAPMSKANPIPVSPPDLHQHLGGLLFEIKKGADVVFDVGGESFAAHRFVLAARSPVFGAELFSQMKESDTKGVIRIEDMEPQVFRALLCFAYTDSLPEMKEEEDAMYQHLLVAADRYGMERLKLMCEDKLSKCIGAGTVATILTLAEQHHCDGLKKACLRFLSAPANLMAVVATDGFEHFI